MKHLAAPKRHLQVNKKQKSSLVLTSGWAALVKKKKRLKIVTAQRSKGSVDVVGEGRIRVTKTVTRQQSCRNCFV